MKRFLFLISIAFVSFAGSASATIIVKMDLPQLVGRSDMIFVGKAIKTHSHWSEGGRHIVTDTTFQVEQRVRGKIGKTVVVRRLGGAVGGIGMRVSGTPVFRKGDEVLLFTERRGGQRHVVGMKQGVHRVFRDAAGKRMVRVRLEGLSLARRTPKGALKLLDGQRSPGPRPLGDFVDRIRQTIDLCAKENSRCAE